MCCIIYLGSQEVAKYYKICTLFALPSQDVKELNNTINIFIQNTLKLLDNQNIALSTGAIFCDKLSIMRLYIFHRSFKLIERTTQSTGTLSLRCVFLV